MPSLVRRSGSEVLQNPSLGLLPSPENAWLGPLGPLRGTFSTRLSGSLSLRPAGLLLLASTPEFRPTPEVDYTAPLAACRSGSLIRWLICPSLGTTFIRRSAHVRRGLHPGMNAP